MASDDAARARLTVMCTATFSLVSRSVPRSQSAVRLVARRHIIDPLQTLEHAPDDIALSGPKGVAYRASLCSLTEPSRDLAIG